METSPQLGEKSGKFPALFPINWDFRDELAADSLHRQRVFAFLPDKSRSPDTATDAPTTRILRITL